MGQLRERLQGSSKRSREKKAEEINAIQQAELATKFGLVSTEYMFKLVIH